MTKTVHKSVYLVTNEQDLMSNLSQHIKVMLMFHVPSRNCLFCETVLTTFAPCVHVFDYNVFASEFNSSSEHFVVMFCV